MSALAPAHPSRAARTRDLVLDSLALAGRNLQHVRQIPEKLLDVTIQPLMFVLLFAYVFGGVIHINGGSYREYLIGGVLDPDAGVRDHGPRDCDRDRPPGGHRRPLPLAADGALGVHRRPPAGRARGGDARHRRALPERADRRLAHPHRSAARARGLRSAGVVRLRHARGRDAARAARALARRRAGLRLHRRLPDDVHRGHVRAARRAATRAAHGRRVQPGERARGSLPHALRQPGGPAGERGLAARSPRAERVPLVHCDHRASRRR